MPVPTHPPRPRTLIAVLALFAAAGAACSDGPSGPESRGGPFTLVAVDGHALPVAMSPNSPVFTEKIEGGTLAFLGGDSLRVTLQVTGGTRELIVRYVRQGDSLVVAPPAGAGGAVNGRDVRLRYGVPAPPSQGFLVVNWHDFRFRL